MELLYTKPNQTGTYMQGESEKTNKQTNKHPNKTKQTNKRNLLYFEEISNGEL